MNGLPKPLWLDMTREDFCAPDVSSWIAVLPIAAVEQHGPHLSVGVDTRIMEAYLGHVLDILPADLKATILPIQAIGKSNEHQAFPGTLSLSAETVLRAWVEIGESVFRAGIRKLVIVNSHGGNMAPMDIVARELRVRHDRLVVHVSWHMLGYPQGLFSDDELRLGIHGGEIETAIMLAAKPVGVRLERAKDFVSRTASMERDLTHLRTGRPAGFGWMAQDLNPEGAMGNAAMATAEKGTAALEYGARAFIALLRDVARFELTSGPT